MNLSFPHAESVAARVLATFIFNFSFGMKGPITRSAFGFAHDLPGWLAVLVHLRDLGWDVHVPEEHGHDTDPPHLLGYGDPNDAEHVAVVDAADSPEAIDFAQDVFRLHYQSL